MTLLNKNQRLNKKSFQICRANGTGKRRQEGYPHLHLLQ